MHPRNETFDNARVTLSHITQERHAAAHIGQSVCDHLFDHICITHVLRADLLAVRVQLFFREAFRAADLVNDVVVEVGVVCLHPVHGFMPERPLRRDLTVDVEEGHTGRVESMKRRVALEEYNRHTHLMSPVTQDTLTRAKAIRRNKGDAI